MEEHSEDQLSNFLAEGWVVVGYSTTMMAMGGIVHSVLLQYGSSLTSFTIVKTGDKEIGRTIEALAPMPPPKKSGWF